MHGKGVVYKKTLSLEAAFLPVMAAFVLLISMVRRLLILLLFPLQCLSSLTAPGLPSGPLLPSPPSNSPPFTPLHHFMPSSPSLKPHVSTFKYILLHGFIKHFRRPELDTVACIHRVKQTIVNNYDFKQICASEYLWGCNKGIL